MRFDIFSIEIMVDAACSPKLESVRFLRRKQARSQPPPASWTGGQRGRTLSPGYADAVGQRPSG